MICIFFIMVLHVRYMYVYACTKTVYESFRSTMWQLTGISRFQLMGNTIYSFFFNSEIFFKHSHCV